MVYAEPRKVESKWFTKFESGLPDLTGKVVAITGCTTGTGFVDVRPTNAHHSGQMAGSAHLATPGEALGVCSCAAARGAAPAALALAALEK